MRSAWNSQQTFKTDVKGQDETEFLQLKAKLEMEKKQLEEEKAQFDAKKAKEEAALLAKRLVQNDSEDSDEEVGARNKAAGSSFIPGLSNPQNRVNERSSDFFGAISRFGQKSIPDMRKADSNQPGMMEAYQSMMRKEQEEYETTLKHTRKRMIQDEISGVPSISDTIAEKLATLAEAAKFSSQGPPQSANNRSRSPSVIGEGSASRFSKDHHRMPIIDQDLLQ